MGTAFCLEQLSPLTAFSTNTEIPKRQWWVYTKCCRKHKQQSDNTIYVRGNMIKLNLNQKWPDVKTKHKNNAKWDYCLRNKPTCGLLMNYLNTVSEQCISTVVCTWIHTETCFLFSFAFIGFDLGGGDGVSRQNHRKHFFKPTALQLGGLLLPPLLWDTIMWPLANTDAKHSYFSYLPPDGSIENTCMFSVCLLLRAWVLMELLMIVKHLLWK